MFFTQEDYNKIEEWFRRKMVKDTDFPSAVPVNGSEKLAIIQDGENRVMDFTAVVDATASKVDAEVEKYKYINCVEYTKHGQYEHAFVFRHNEEIVKVIDAGDFILDKAVEDVKVENDNLVIVFNVDAGSKRISIPLSKIFDSDNYFNKNEVNTLLKDLETKLKNNRDFIAVDFYDNGMHRDIRTYEESTENSSKDEGFYVVLWNGFHNSFEEGDLYEIPNQILLFDENNGIYYCHFADEADYKLPGKGYYENIVYAVFEEGKSLYYKFDSEGNVNVYNDIKVENADWNAEEDEPGFILNKPQPISQSVIDSKFNTEEELEDSEETSTEKYLNEEGFGRLVKNIHDSHNKIREDYDTKFTEINTAITANTTSINTLRENSVSRGLRNYFPTNPPDSPKLYFDYLEGNLYYAHNGAYKTFYDSKFTEINNKLNEVSGGSGVSGFNTLIRTGTVPPGEKERYNAADNATLILNMSDEFEYHFYSNNTIAVSLNTTYKKGFANGIAPLGADQTVPEGNLPKFFKGFGFYSGEGETKIGETRPKDNNFPTFWANGGIEILKDTELENHDYILRLTQDYSKGGVDGVAPLDRDMKIPEQHIPDGYSKTLVLHDISDSPTSSFGVMWEEAKLLWEKKDDIISGKLRVVLSINDSHSPVETRLSYVASLVYLNAFFTLRNKIYRMEVILHNESTDAGGTNVNINYITELTF